MTSAVIDASVALRLAIPRAETDAARAAVRQHALIAPWLILPECANGLCKFVRAKKLSADAASEGLSALSRIIETVADARLAHNALTLANRLNHSAYDCFYLALVQQSGAPLLTADRLMHARASELSLSVLPLIAVKDDTT